MEIQTQLSSWGLVIADTISGIIKNLPIFILIVWGVKTISKQMPKWIHEMFIEMNRIIVLERAVNRRF